MRIVIDTNVLISAFIGRGRSHQVFEHCVRNHQIVTSQFVLDELQEKLIDKFKYSEEAAHEVVALLQSTAEIIAPQTLASSVCRDSDDDNILATAVTGQCQLIITGDKDLLVLQRINDIAIVNPATFSEMDGVD